jgi:hypothetical protein
VFEPSDRKALNTREGEAPAEPKMASQIASHGSAGASPSQGLMQPFRNKLYFTTISNPQNHRWKNEKVHSNLLSH